MIIFKPKPYIILIYCVSFFFLVFDTLIGIFQLINIVQGGVGSLFTNEGLFRIINIFVDLLTLIGMSVVLLVLWRKIFVKVLEEEFVIYSKPLIILAIIGATNLFFALFLSINPFFMDFNLNESPIGHIYDVLVKVGLIFLLLGILGIALNKSEKWKRKQ